MKKNYLKSLLALGLSVSMLAACGGGGGTTSTKTSSASKTSNASTATSSTTASKSTSAATSNGDAIRLINGKIEIDAQLKEAAKLFKEKTGQEVVIESMGGGVD